jgi:pathogenesis-related protein 1
MLRGVLAHVLPAFFLLAAAGGTSPLSREMLVAHNAVRKRVGAPPLAWSNELASYAQQWADSLLASGEFRHRPNPVYGENLFDVTGASASPGEVVADWAAEARNYDYQSNRCRDVCGHYTQIVWAGTKQVGCAVARGPNRKVWVCNYNPPGNRVGRRPY